MRRVRATAAGVSPRRLRIVAGRLRGRTLAVPSGDAVRPTSDRAREALFNVLIHRCGRDGRFSLVGATVLDAFAGTGALGLEALSRGARHAVFLDRDAGTVRDLAVRVTDWGVAEETTVLRADTTRPPARSDGVAPASLVFLDPPYGMGLPGPALMALVEAGWLAPGALCVVETDRGEALPVPDGFDLIDDRVQGRARLRILRRRAVGE
jgi:16S rRNA (guanine966-N2)-methyltransferase